MPKRKKPPESLWVALLPCHILILPQTTFFYKQKTILNPLSPFILYGRTVLEVFRMLLTLLQFFASKFLVLALHLEAGSFPRPLSPQEEIQTFAALRAGDPSAREKLIRHNLRLVAHIAKKYYALPSEQDDLISIGTIGLMKAVDTFDSTRRARFSTYASRCIENAILSQRNKWRLRWRKSHEPFGAKWSMYYFCAFRCFTAASTSSSFCSVEQGSFRTFFSA